MPRTLSLSFRAAMNAQETGEIPIVLLTITHEDAAEPIRISGDPTERLTTDPLVYGTTSRGETFTFIPFALSLPEDAEGTGPNARLVLDNVSRELIPLIRSIATPAQVLLETVMASDLDYVEVQFPSFDITKVSYDAASITLELTMDPLVTEPFPADSFDPANFPGLFG